MHRSTFWKQKLIFQWRYFNKILFFIESIKYFSLCLLIYVLISGVINKSFKCFVVEELLLEEPYFLICVLLKNNTIKHEITALTFEQWISPMFCILFKKESKNSSFLLCLWVLIQKISQKCDLFKFLFFVKKYC